MCRSTPQLIKQLQKLNPTVAILVLGSKGGAISAVGALQVGPGVTGMLSYGGRAASLKLPGPVMVRGVPSPLWGRCRSALRSHLCAAHQGYGVHMYPIHQGLRAMGC